jgi:phosphatidylglycerophosphatase GEP4
MERESDFRPPRDEDLIVVGDRIFTDVVLANRMRPRSSVPTSESSTLGPLAIWTTHVWEKESMLMRWAEGRLVRAVEAWTKPLSPPFNAPTHGYGNGSEIRNGQDSHVRRFVKNNEVGQAKPSLSDGEGGGVASAAVGTGGVARWVWERVRRS